MSVEETALRCLLEGLDRLAVAVSGGVDSSTLAALAHRVMGRRATMLHAVSPAVPVEATERLRRRAEAEGWSLRLLDAAELADPRYRANPVDRCFYCKANLYAAIGRVHPGPIASGTNLDDLGDFRPGLRAAEAAGVRHPFVEAGIGKRGVRALARAMGLDEFAELPASPCLASRLETGVAVTPERLRLVAEVERMLAARLGPGDQRCRVRGAGIVVELEERHLERLEDGERARLLAEVERVLEAAGGRMPVGLAPYRRGSAFLRGRGA